MKKITLVLGLILIPALLSCKSTKSQPDCFKVIAFYTGENDLAHISYVSEANKWFPKAAETYNFEYDSTTDWSKLNSEVLTAYDVVLFLDTRPEKPEQRAAFEQYMINGGGFIGFHFSAFALANSAYDDDWDWYHHEFLGAGEYKGNTWRPTSAQLKVEATDHPVTKNLPTIFTSAPNEWYSWQSDLTQSSDIEILVSIDPSSYPLGTGPKEWEIWTEGYYPVVWTNTKYRMVYINMGHNDMDYEGGTNAPLSSTFQSEEQNQMLINALLWLGRGEAGE